MLVTLPIPTLLLIPFLLFFTFLVRLRIHLLILASVFLEKVKFIHLKFYNHLKPGSTFGLPNFSSFLLFRYFVDINPRRI